MRQAKELWKRRRHAREGVSGLMNRRIPGLLFALAGLLLGVAAPVSAAMQTTHLATVTERTGLRAGPGDTYALIATLNPGTPATIIERNRPGNWLHIRAESSGGDLEGWAMTGFFDLGDVRFSQVLVNTMVPDADVSQVADPDLAQLYGVPVIPRISPAMQEVYAQGQEIGIDSSAVTKVGDSNSASRLYLTPIGDGNYNLGPYDFLQATVDFFGGSLATPSVAARVGLNAFSLFDPIWADPTQCESGETPLQCEYRRKMPAVSVIMFGPNDLRALNSEQYTQQITRIVEETLDHGIIPVLSTFSANPDDDIWFQAVRFNLILTDIAAQYEVPIVNLWAAARALPRYGMGEDNVHLTSSGTAVNFSTGYESRYGVSLQNLIVLQTLDEIRRAVIAD